ncbi:MotB family protein [Hyphomicrobium sp.]|uniref:MotB family protein n=1 Tax=Hyphomicrobium sp. TaxID=82 RepID=UPI002E310F38|nr:MotB family protein [Hyphomicrobium sp.]HEX2841789.1 MotB family protein [Hyphomicrobium sp.]
MSADGDAPVPHEVVIVRRRGGDGDDGHHGGAWKIAFADLMTAMMAFFLVMWLLNVSDKEKIQQIATYFNPLKLNSKRPTIKGVEEERDTEKAAPVTVGPSDRGADVSTVDEKNKRQALHKPGGDGELEDGVAQKAEEDLFNDPYGVLSRLALKAESESESEKESSAAKSDNTLPGGNSNTNPFEPFPEQSVTNKSAAQSEHEQMTLEEPGEHPLPPGLEKPLEVKPDLAEDAPADATSAKTTTFAGAPDASAPEQSARDKEAEQALNAEIMKALKDLAPDKKPSIDVRLVSEGVLISLTDDFRFGMFASASAEPRPETVVVMEKVAKVLAEREGEIVVRGHTDARPFKSERNNNWRLSMERAQIAYYMLARGGVKESRFDAIEGHADRNLKIPSDPNAAENRRIEILLRLSKT